jgi:hypothetical protein
MGFTIFHLPIQLHDNVDVVWGVADAQRYLATSGLARPYRTIINCRDTMYRVRHRKTEHLRQEYDFVRLTKPCACCPGLRVRLDPFHDILPTYRVPIIRVRIDL